MNYSENTIKRVRKIISHSLDLEYALKTISKSNWDEGRKGYCVKGALKRYEEQIDEQMNGDVYDFWTDDDGEWENGKLPVPQKRYARGGRGTNGR
tara:strand:+ start:1479 stop:1763 length:285 start_codon:yes stop_codon:yes gene_type:complete